MLKRNMFIKKNRNKKLEESMKV